MNNKVAVYRKEHFNAAHRLHNSKWDASTNTSIFGKCNNPNFHGHNYELVVKVVGEPDPETGFVIDLKVLGELIEENILNRFDHKNLNVEIEEFNRLNPTAENISIVIYKILREKLNPALDLQVRLYETERNFVEYPAY